MERDIWTEKECENFGETLKSGEKYTFVMYSDFGMPTQYQVRVFEAEIKPYAQYDYSIRLTYKPKGAKKSRVMRFCGIKDVVIYKGWINAKDSVQQNKVLKETSEVRVTQGVYRSFSKQYYYDVIEALKLQNIEPVFSLIFDKAKSLESI